jgi:formate hydrogenlyase subunit 3/multisubunit Na+/H+ antiporter MnhD subunit
MTLIGLINLGGLPFSFGFFIKHYTVLTLFDFNNWFIKINLFIGMFSSLIYSYRLYYYVFFDTKKAKKAIYLSASKITLKSYFYSNTTLASSIAITSLLVISAGVITYMLFAYFYVDGVNNNLSYWSFSNKTYYLIQNTVETSNLISTLINWFILIVGIVLLTIKFRYQQFFDIFIDKINGCILTLFFLFIFTALL